MRGEVETHWTMPAWTLVLRLGHILRSVMRALSPEVESQGWRVGIGKPCGVLGCSSNPGGEVRSNPRRRWAVQARPLEDGRCCLVAPGPWRGRWSGSRGCSCGLLCSPAHLLPELPGNRCSGHWPSLGHHSLTPSYTRIMGRCFLPEGVSTGERDPTVLPTNAK